MSEPVIPARAKLFAGIIYLSEESLSEAERLLIKKFGCIDHRTSKIPFTHTDYYSDMGNNLNRVFFSFEKLIPREKISEIKIFTNRLEKKISGKGKRRINIDPGYITLSNVFLASCKDFFHRVYLKDGVYLENEYRYVGREYRFWEWTYPDYKKFEYLDFFYTMRKTYKNQLK